MQPVQNTLIQPVGESEFGAFFRYLNDHISDNGADATGYFQPLARGKSNLPPDTEQSFRDGLNLTVGRNGWRRAWVARSPDRQIAGHTDLRSHRDHFAEHRCLLGMGIDRAHRKRGLGMALLAHAGEWALANALEWIDLQVLSANEPAIRLYHSAGFEKVGEIPEMFKIDGRLFSYTTMTKCLRNNPPAIG
jgi:ribosomal protein S18 acetylase RimI-like enzyme